LGGNDLNSVPTAALSILENLHKLELPENRITEISEGDFQGERKTAFLRMEKAAVAFCFVSCK
jgi:hypothetical protein